MIIIHVHNVVYNQQLVSFHKLQECVHIALRKLFLFFSAPFSGKIGKKNNSHSNKIKYAYRSIISHLDTFNKPPNYNGLEVYIYST